MRILVVDDDPDMQRSLQEFLSANGIEVAIAEGRKSMETQLASGRFDLVLLDMRLGSEDGLDLLRTIRGEGDMPVIIVSGHRREEIDRVVGLELGADDYLMKPIALRELLARIRTVLRRADSQSEHVASGKSRFRGWEVDRRLRTLRDPKGEITKLTKGEYALLVAFLDAPGRPLTREQLMNATRVHEDVFDRSIDVQILRLRRKLEQDPTQPEIIVTERGHGYLFAAPVETVR